jgi:hypothetical protein
MNRSIPALALALAATIQPVMAQLPAAPKSELPSPEPPSLRWPDSPSPPPAAPSRETLLRQQMQAREDARGWRTFGGSTYYAWKEWKLISPGIRATAYKIGQEPSSGGGLVPLGLSGKVSVSCPTLAWRYWEPGLRMGWGRTSGPPHWGSWRNAGSPDSTPEADSMVTALCANVPASARAGREVR